MPATTDTICVPFPAWAIQAFLGGRKTQFRAPVDPQPDVINHGHPEKWVEAEIEVRQNHGVPGLGEVVDTKQGKDLMRVECPYPPGTEIAVQEAFRLPSDFSERDAQDYIDFFDSEVGLSEALPPVYWAANETAHDYRGGPHNTNWGRLRPAKKMPEALCRIRLHVEDVGVERVQDISDEDVFAEGIEYAEGYGCRAGDSDVWYDFPDKAFAHLWDSIHGDGAWGRNDYVWVVTFSPLDT